MSAFSSLPSPVAQRYSSALYELAVDKKAVDKVEVSLKSLHDTIAHNENLQSILNSPVLPVSAVTKVMVEVLKGIKADPLTKNTVLLMVSKRRASSIIGLYSGFSALTAKLKGEVTAYITAATPLTPAQEKELTTLLSKKLKLVVRSEVSINPSLIGGLTVQIGSQLIDSSIKTKISSLQLSLKGA